MEAEARSGGRKLHRRIPSEWRKMEEMKIFNCIFQTDKVWLVASLQF